MENTNLIIGGDLNFSIGQAETWGPNARADPLSYFFSLKIIDGNMMDLFPLNMRPTWINRRFGEARVAKRMDRFLIKEEILDNIPLIW